MSDFEPKMGIFQTVVWNFQKTGVLFRVLVILNTGTKLIFKLWSKIKIQQFWETYWRKTAILVFKLQIFCKNIKFQIKNIR